MMVHGFATNRAENWRRLGWYGAFERKGYRVVAFDHRGHGDSGKPLRSRPSTPGRDGSRHRAPAGSSGDRARRPDGLLDGRGLSLEAALDTSRPGRNLIVGGFGARTLERGQQHNQGAADAHHDDGDAMRRPTPDTITERTLRAFGCSPISRAPTAWRWRLQPRARPALRERGDLARVGPPTLVVGPTTAWRATRRASPTLIPGAKAVTLPACDHFSAIPHALFKAAVFDFLEGWLE